MPPPDAPLTLPTVPTDKSFMKLAAYFVGLVLFTHTSFAAYRVYEIKVEHYDTLGTIERTEKVLTTLDPLQYAAFQGGDGRMKVRMQDTWYCPGDTSRRSYCAKPKVRQRTPASMQHDSRVPLPYNRQPVIP